MKREWQPRHWFVFGLMLLCEAIGLSITAQRTETQTHAFRQWAFIGAAAVVVAFASSALLVTLFDAMFPNGISRRKRTLVAALCVLSGVVAWRLVR